MDFKELTGYEPPPYKFKCPAILTTFMGETVVNRQLVWVTEDFHGFTAENIEHEAMPIVGSNQQITKITEDSIGHFNVVHHIYSIVHRVTESVDRHPLRFHESILHDVEIYADRLIRPLYGNRIRCADIPLALRDGNMKPIVVCHDEHPNFLTLDWVHERAHVSSAPSRKELKDSNYKWPLMAFCFRQSLRRMPRKNDDMSLVQLEAWAAAAIDWVKDTKHLLRTLEHYTQV